MAKCAPERPMRSVDPPFLCLPSGILLPLSAAPLTQSPLTDPAPKTHP